MVKQQNNQPFIGVSHCHNEALVKLGEALFNLVKRGFPFPKVLSSVCSEAPPKVSFTTMSMSPADRKSICPHRGRNRYECARSYREYGSSILRASSNPQNGIWFTWFPTWSLGNFQFAPGEGCGVELRQKLPPLTACFTIITAKPGTNRTFQFVKVLLRLTWWNDSYSKIAKPDTRKIHKTRFWLAEVGSCHSTTQTRMLGVEQKTWVRCKLPGIG